MAANNLIMNGNGGVPFGNYFVLGSSNLTLSASNWTRLATNQFDGSGTFAFTNAVIPGPPQLFYRVQVP